MEVHNRALTMFGGRMGPFSVLTVHFFNRFFHNETVDFEDQMKQQMISAVAILAGFIGLVSYILLTKYLPPAPQIIPGLAASSWVDKCYVLSLTMVVMSFAVLLDWEMLFPDAQDFMNLMPLPVRPATWLSAKAASFVLFVGMISLGMNAPALVAFPFFLGDYIGSSPLIFLLFGAAHALAAFSTAFFMFLAIGVIQGVLMTVLPDRLFRKMAVAIRFLLLTVFIVVAVFLFMKMLGGTFDRSLSSLTALKAAGSPLLEYYPPLWFTGIYEVLLGNKDPFFHHQAFLALRGLGVAAVLFILTFALSYRRHVRRSLEDRKKKVRKQGGVINVVSEAFMRAILPDPRERAVYSFFGKTLARSNHHKMKMVTSTAVAASLILIILVAGGLRIKEVDPWNLSVMAIPLFFSFFILAGIRMIVDIPYVRDANWVFRITEEMPPARYLSGLKKAVILKAVLPLHLALTALFIPFLHWGAAIKYMGFCFLAAVLLLEIFLFGYRKIPFACSWVPGKMKPHALWPVYAMIILFYTYGLAAIAKSLIKKPGPFFPVLIGMIVLVIAAEVIGRLPSRSKEPLLFDEAPEPAMVTLAGAERS